MAQLTRRISWVAETDDGDCVMNREDVLRVVRAARESEKRPDLSGTDLYDTDLRGVDLRGVDLRGANLYGATLRCADLFGADLRGVDLWVADLRGANLREASLGSADLRGTDLRGANLRGANLWGANLRGANLREADLRGANLQAASLWSATWGGLQITDLPSGQLTLTPTCDGWRLRVGCWDGTPDQLRNLIAQDEGWPEAEGDEITRRRSYLQAALTLCEVHMKDHAGVIDKLKERWGNE